MGKINRLDEHLSNMIAAGEVVERPMGIVKELVENSIDANAHQIEIQVVQGGIESITIIDDGDGMDAQDASLAFERHATSKLKDVDDLWKIHTMGFRGEALPSIASVSHVLLRTNNGEDATEVEISYGKVVHARPCGTPKGTMFQVKNLFQKTPARFKHLKSPQYEFSLISDVVQKFALSHPNIGFCLSHDGRTVFKTRGNGSLLEVLMQIYGRDTVKSAIALKGKDLDYEITGYAIQPQFHRATKYYMLLYINDRMVRNHHLQKAIQDAYAPYITKDRYPIAVVKIKMDAHLVDVNVHPSKWEIRLSKEKQLENLVYQTISDALKKGIAVPSFSPVKEKKEKIEVQELSFTYRREPEVKEIHEQVNQSFVQPVKELKEEQEQAPITYPLPVAKEPIMKAEESSVVYEYDKKVNIQVPDIKQQMKQQIAQVQQTFVEKSQTKQKELVENIPPIVEQKEEPKVQIMNPSLPQLQVIGQFHKCYILAEGEKGLYIIDQHAAQERYHYEQIRERILKGENDTQPLLLPITIESSAVIISQLDQLNQVMQNLGIQLEAFGDTTLVCRELPIWMKHVEEVGFLQDMIDVWFQDKEVSLEKLRKHAIATMACHSSIRFNRTLTMDEMKQVIDDLGKCEQPFHCPHGRPTLICLEDRTLFYEFERG